MKITELDIEGFRRHEHIKVFFSDTSFLIGENNVGKSTILTAIEMLFNDKGKKLSETDFYRYELPDGTLNIADEVVFTAKIIDLPEDAFSWIGFRGRIFKENIIDLDVNEIQFTRQTNCVYYKKVYRKNEDRKIFLKAANATIKEEFHDAFTPNEFVQLGFPQQWLDNDHLTKPSIKLPTDRDKKMNQNDRNTFFRKYEAQFNFFDYDETVTSWDENPGGFASIVLSKLPDVILIPVNDGMSDLDGSNGALQLILKDLFDTVRDSSPHYQKAKKYLDLLALELNPNDCDTDFGLMMSDLNSTITGVFSGVGLYASAKLSDPSVIKPTFEISMKSNVSTPVSNQGTGVIRSAVFALLRYRASINRTIKPLIICFEEPEVYLHPNAANQMRDTIYSLSTRDTNIQIICTTHSPYMIDLGKKPYQLLNLIGLVQTQQDFENAEGEADKFILEITKSKPFNIMDGFRILMKDEKDRLKLTLKMDDYLSRVFFSKKVLVVEGDTEEIVLRYSIDIMPEDLRDRVINNWQIIRARGKPVIISLVKYLQAVGIDPYVMHDRDADTPGALKFNTPIQEALSNDCRLTVLDNCIEDILGYPVSTSEKPFRAYEFMSSNWNSWDSVPENWKQIVGNIFDNND